MGVTLVQKPRNPKDTQELQRARLAVGRFVRALQILLRAARLYQKNHPHVMESLETADTALRGALEHVAPLEIRVERSRLVFRGQAMADSRGELKTLADHLLRRGVTSLVFLPNTHLGEVGTLAQLLGSTPLQPAGDSVPDWRTQLAVQHIEGIRINEPLEEKKADTILTTLVAAVLAPDLSALLVEQAGGNGEGITTAAPGIRDVPAQAEDIEELAGTLHLLARIAEPLRKEKRPAPAEVVAALRDAVAGTDRRGLTLLAGALTTHAPEEGEGIDAYFSRLAELLARAYAARAFHASGVATQGLRHLFGQLSERLAETGIPRPARLDGAKWTTESYAQYMNETFWAGLPAPEKAEILRGADTWCVPVATLRPYIEQLAAAGGQRQARFILLNYARCLELESREARLAAASGLTEMEPLIGRLWPSGQGPSELVRVVTRALVAETAPEVAGVLAAVLDGLALLAQERGDHNELESILEAIERTPGSTRHGVMKTLRGSILSDVRWDRLVDASLEHRPLDASLPRILGRDPERLIDSLGARLNEPEGMHALAAMARLLRAIGEPAVGALVSRLYDPRTQRATSAVKLLSVARPERLVEALPRALPSWDWNLQDMAVGELVRQGVPGSAQAFLEALPQAHALVVPMMIDEIGLEGETRAVDLLLEIAAGQHERLNDVFVRIKAVEALGRMRALEAADVLRAIVRGHFGLTHAEPAGLRAAAEEALGLIENRPSSARVRIVQQATEKASVSFTRARRYLRVPLDAPLAARIWTPEAARSATAVFAGPSAPAKVKTLSLGGAFVESAQRLSVGDSLGLEIRSGLRRIQGTAVVRNTSPEGGGVEFVHMKQEDREKLRRLVSRLLKQ